VRSQTHILTQIAPPFVIGFMPRGNAYPGDVLSVVFNELVDCASPVFSVALLTSLVPPMVPVNGLSTLAQNLIVKCTDNTIAIALKPGVVSFLMLAGQNAYLLLTGVRDVAGNLVTCNILATSPNYLYMAPGNVESVVTFQPVGSSWTSFAITALELIGIADPMHGKYPLGSSQWQTVANKVAQMIGSAVGIEPGRGAFFFSFALISAPW